jgi:hypothetical protein
MHFRSLDEAFQFYTAYARLAGFDVKKNRKRGKECPRVLLHKRREAQGG